MTDETQLTRTVRSEAANYLKAGVLLTAGAVGLACEVPTMQLMGEIIGEVQNNRELAALAGFTFALPLGLAAASLVAVNGARQHFGETYVGQKIGEAYDKLCGERRFTQNLADRLTKELTSGESYTLDEVRGVFSKLSWIPAIRLSQIKVLALECRHEPALGDISGMYSRVSFKKQGNDRYLFEHYAVSPY